MNVLDLFSGLKGWSKPFEDRGHSVVSVDVESKFNPTICKDIVKLSVEDLRKYGKFDIVLASPPCIEFSKTSFPQTWKSVQKFPPKPDTTLLEHTIKIINVVQPRWWIIENVRGAVKYFKPLLGDCVKHVGSRYLWGNFPMFDCPPQYGKWKLSKSPNRPVLCSLIPYILALNVCIACERELR